MISIIFKILANLYMSLLITLVFAPPVAILVIIYFIGLVIYTFKDIKKKRQSLEEN